MKNILMVIDMQNDFLLEGAPLDAGETARGMVPFIKAKVDAYLQAGDTVIFTGDWHEPNDREFERFAVHCVKDTPGARIVDELQYALKQPQVSLIHKARFSAFYGTRLSLVLEDIQRTNNDGLHIEVTGVCTNICVLFTVEELRNRGYDVTVHRQGTASFDHAAHENALSQMQSVLGAQII